MTHDDIDAALALAAEAKARADAATPGPWLHVAVTGQTRRSTALNIYTADAQQLIVSDSDTLDTAEFIAAARSDVPALADAVRRLADELLTARAVLSDATSESAMYEYGERAGVKAALAVLDEAVRLTSVAPGHEPHESIRHIADAVRALLIVREPCTDA